MKIISILATRLTRVRAFRTLGAVGERPRQARRSTVRLGAQRSGTAGTVFLLAIVAALSGCGDSQQVDDVDFARYCADHVVNVVADDSQCAITGDNPTSRFQWAYADTGHHVWNNGFDSTPDYAFVPIGQPMPYGVIYTRPYNYAYHQPLVYSSRPVHRAVSVPYAQFKKTAPKLPANAPKAATVAPAVKPAAPAPNPGVQRGGFGVPSAPRATTPAKTPTFSGRTSTPSRSTSSSKTGK